MKILAKIYLLLALCMTTMTLQAQKKPFYNTEEEVIEAAYKQLDFSMREGALKEWAEDNQPKGTYTMELALINKGEVVTVRTIGRSDDGDIPTQNALKNFMKTYRFPFKMSKTQSSQFRYEFKF